MGKILNEFRYKIPCTSKIKKLVGFNKNSNQIKLFIELKKEFLEMTEYNYASKKTINNLFKYIDKNIVSNDYNYIKNIVNILVQIFSIFEEKINNENFENKSGLELCYYHILYHIKLLENNLAKKLNKNDYELEKIILFEKISYTILEKRDLQKSVKCINNNIEILNYNNYSGKNIEQLLFEKYTHAKIINDIKSLVYYTCIIKHIMILHKININRKKFSDIINENKIIEKNTTKLDKKLKLLKYDPDSQRFDLTNEKIMSIDSNGTKLIYDALSIEKYSNGSFILGIHIADVCDFINDKFQLLNLEKIPFYNIKAASLDKGYERNAVTLFVEITKDGIFNDYRIIKSKIKNNEKLYHQDVKMVLNNKNDNKITKFILELSELYMIVENTKLDSNPPAYRIGELIVEKFMILFGCIVCKYFNENNLPYIYLNSVDGKKPIYSTINNYYNTGFENQGLNVYGRATSPIIDSVSRMNQALLYEYVFDYKDELKKLKLDKKLDCFIEKINKKQN